MESTHDRELLAEISKLLQAQNIKGIRNALHQEALVSLYDKYTGYKEEVLDGSKGETRAILDSVSLCRKNIAHAPSGSGNQFAFSLCFQPQ